MKTRIGNIYKCQNISILTTISKLKAKFM